MDEKYFMDEAFKEARQALALGEVPVGCVFVYNNRIIARSGNRVNLTKNASRHAELICIDQLLDYCSTYSLKSSSVFPNLSVYVTVEPCIMCSAALNNLNIKEIIYGCTNDRFGGYTVVNVSQVLDHQLPIRGGFEAELALSLLKEFYKCENPSAPSAIKSKMSSSSS